MLGVVIFYDFHCTCKDNIKINCYQIFGTQFAKSMKDYITSIIYSII